MNAIPSRLIGILRAIPLALGMLCVPDPSYAQEPADRAALKICRTSLAGKAVGDVASEVRRLQAIHNASPRDKLQLAFAILSLGRASLGDTDLLRALSSFGRLVEEHADWPEAWLGLGLTREALAARRTIAREGPLQPLGMSYAAGAERALVRALELDAGFSEAAEALGQLTAIDPAKDFHRTTLTALRRATSGDGAPDILLIRARWESAAGETDSTIGVLERYLRAGGDSAIGNYYLARQFFRAGSSARAAATYFRGIASATSALAQGLYRQDIAWIATGEELAEYDSTASFDRLAWLRRFWDRRDVADGRPPGARLAEHYRRYEYVLANFRIDPPRHRWAQRSSDSDEAHADADAATTEAGVVNEPAWGELSSQLFGEGSSFRAYKPTQSVVDDRGTIYMRHGPPDQVAFSVDVPANVSWKYVRQDGDLIFHFVESDFDGSVGPTMLVPTLTGKRMLEARCGFDTEMCGLATRGRVPPEQVVRQRNRGQAAILVGTTTDGYPRTFREEMQAVVQVHGLFGEAEGKGGGRLLTIFAAPSKGLRPSTSGAETGAVFYQLRVQVVAFNQQTGQRFDLDTLRNFRTGHALAPGEYLSGLSELAVPPGEYLVTVILSQGGEDRGSGTRVSPVRVPEGKGERLELSDVVLGRKGAGLVWRTGRVEIPLNPLNAFNRKLDVDLFFEARGLDPSARYDVQLVFSPASDPKKPALTLKFEDQPEGPTRLFRRSMDIRSLKAGDYLLRVILHSRQGKEPVERLVRLNVIDG